jgi:hypothetical protein
LTSLTISLTLRGLVAPIRRGLTSPPVFPDAGGADVGADADVAVVADFDAGFGGDAVADSGGSCKTTGLNSDMTNQSCRETIIFITPAGLISIHGCEG